jgi:hypothetical protein
MRTGIIIVFKDHQKEIDHFELHKTSFPICLVNNASRDDTLKGLENIRFKNPFYFSILDIKKDRGLKKAINAGSRFLTSQNDLTHIGFIIVAEIKNPTEINDLIMNLEKQPSKITDIKEKSPKNVNYLKQVFSVLSLSFN